MRPSYVSELGFKFGMCFLLTLSLGVVRFRSAVVITGTTVGPNFKRKEEKLAGHCPDFHPWAFSNGTMCCLNFHRAGNINADLDWYDEESLCPQGNAIPCPSFLSERLVCVTNPTFKVPEMCPQDYPIQMQNACCWSYRRKVDSNCDGDLIANDDPAICCPDEKLFQPLDCKLFKRKCLAPVLENVRTFCPLQPTRRRLSTQDFTYMTHIRDDIPFTSVKRYCGPEGGIWMPITNQSLTDALQLLRDPKLGLPPGDVRTYLIGALKTDKSSECDSRTSCIGKIVNLPSLEPLDFTDGWTDQVDIFSLSSLPIRGIALEIRLNPSFVRLKNVNIGSGSGSFLCQIPCLD